MILNCVRTLFFFFFLFKKWCVFLTQNWQSVQDFLHRCKELCMFTMQMYQQSKKNILLLRKSNNNNNNNNNNNTKGLTFELVLQNRSPAVHKAGTSLQHGSTSKQKLHAIQNIKHFGLKIAKRLKIHLGDRLKKKTKKLKTTAFIKAAFTSRQVLLLLFLWTRNLN